MDCKNAQDLLATMDGDGIQNFDTPRSSKKFGEHWAGTAVNGTAEETVGLEIVQVLFALSGESEEFLRDQDNSGVYFPIPS